jgi:histidinol-phosphate aminotransferase
MNERPEQQVPSYIRAIAAYRPGKPIEEVEREMGITAVKLASNENPLGPSPRAVRAANKALADANRYPDGSGLYLRTDLAKRLRIDKSNLILGGGSTEIIDLVAHTLLRAGLDGITSQGTFPIYSTCIQSTGARLIEVPLRDYVFDLEAIADAVTLQTRVIYLANPNNPTGTMFNAKAFQAFLDRVPRTALVVLDEAYFEYVASPGYSRSVELVREGRSLLVLRTFSKIYGLAGLRVGYGIGPAGLLDELNKVRLPFNTSGVAQAAGIAALTDRGHVRRSLASNRAGLKQMARGIARFTGVRLIPSTANFVLIELGQDSEAFAERLQRLGVIVRPMTWFGFPQAIRVSVGTARENIKFLCAMADLLTVPAQAAFRPAARRVQKRRPRK